MGCFGLAIAGLLALAVPASIAPASLVGALVVIGVLAVLAAAALTRRRPADRVRTLVTIGIAAVVYAGVVVAIHLAAR